MAGRPAAAVGPDAACEEFGADFSVFKHRTAGSRQEEKGKGAQGCDRHSTQRGGSPGVRGGLSWLSHSSLSGHG